MKRNILAERCTETVSFNPEQWLTEKSLYGDFYKRKDLHEEVLKDVQTRSLIRGNVRVYVTFTSKGNSSTTTNVPLPFTNLG